MTSEQLEHEFPLLQPALKSFVLRMTASVQDAEDIVQETYLKARHNIDGFRGESTLKTWLFTIGANLARDLLRQRKRWPENVTDICKDAALGNPEFFQEAMAIRHNSPQGEFEIKEHVAFCLTCVAKSLPLEQQLVLMLREVYRFSTRETALIIDQSEAMVKYHLHEARQTMIAIFDRRCALINKAGICHQCTELNGIFNPKQDTQVELIKLRLVRDAAKGDKAALFDLRLQILQELDPFESGAATLQLHHLEHNRQVMARYLDENP